MSIPHRPVAKVMGPHEETTNRPDQWKIAQGMAGALLPALDMTGPETKEIPPQQFGPLTKDEEAIKSVGDRAKLFARERKGWKGFVEWENYPEKKAAAHKILSSQTWPPNPEYQLAEIPGTNPVLPGTRFKLWHHALGGELEDVVDDSWNCVLEEKHVDMLHLLQFPYNGEPPKRLTAAKDITPNSLHFVRNHGGIPCIDKDDFSFDMDGLVKNPKTFTLDDLMDESRFPRMEKHVTIQCSGTRRIEQIAKYPGQGDEVPQAPWAEGAIGTAKWTGVSLKAVIKECGGLVDGAKHVEFYGADTYVKGEKAMNYLVSVPWSKVKANEVMLAWAMNDEPLPKIHGFPLRTVVFGYIGARSVKWLYRIKAIKQPSRAPVQSQEYLYFPQQVGKHNFNLTDGIQIQEMPVSSAIMSPWMKQVVIHNGKIRCKGWAYSGGGRWPERVELSADGGFNWYTVPLENLSKKRKWTWRTWHMELPCDVEGWIEIVVRCWDNSLNTQPPEVRTAWNWGLHVTSSCHRVSVYSINKTRPKTQARLAELDSKNIPIVPITVPLEVPAQVMEDRIPSLLTLIITTSPTPSAPETELLTQVIASYRRHCPSLLTCRVIVVLDTYDHIKPRARLKRGQVTAQGAQVYDVYKENVKELFLAEFCPGLPPPIPMTQSSVEAEFGFDGRNNPLGSAVSVTVSRTDNDRVTFVEPADRLGFGLAVRTALRLTETSYVWIHQHDWTLVTDIPIAGMLDVMEANKASPAGLPSTLSLSSLSLSSASTSEAPASALDTTLLGSVPGSPAAADTAGGTGDDAFTTDLESPPVKYICLPSCRLLSYAVQAHVTYHSALLRLTRQLKRTFIPSSSSLPSIPLTPLFFWHDKPHIAEVSHYLARVFPTRLSMARGAFIEDTVGHRARDQMKLGNWTKWACWMYYPDEGKRLCLRHLHGRTWRGSVLELEKKEHHITMNIKGKRNQKKLDKKKEKREAGPADVDDGDQQATMTPPPKEELLESIESVREGVMPATPGSWEIPRSQD
ncbi:hypothetical protein PspLS_11669 [Pyricularia sp. CBS 133598]|nr:hypothetical protein PspLS_11669 [Pyricularia sp. CBS 133598]